jgi:hypothetical protein
MDPTDFTIDFNDYKIVKRLFATRLFYVSGDYVGTTKASISLEMLKKYDYPYIDVPACIFWSESGCRLRADARPTMCRDFGPLVGYCSFYNIIRLKHDHPWRKYMKVLDRLDKEPYNRNYVFNRELEGIWKNKDVIDLLKVCGNISLKND